MRKLLSLLGMLMIGDAAAALVGPRRHLQAWEWSGGPTWYNRPLQRLSQHPAQVVALAVLELLVGLAAVFTAERR